MIWGYRGPMLPSYTHRRPYMPRETGSRRSFGSQRLCGSQYTSWSPFVTSTVNISRCVRYGCCRSRLVARRGRQVRCLDVRIAICVPKADTDEAGLAGISRAFAEVARASLLDVSTGEQTGRYKSRDFQSAFTSCTPHHIPHHNTPHPVLALIPDRRSHSDISSHHDLNGTPSPLLPSHCCPKNFGLAGQGCPFPYIYIY